jgi:hypothetical protein
MSAAYALANSSDTDNNLENQLKRSLRPVNPNPEFVGHLHNRLTSPVVMTIERRQNTALGLFLVAFSLMSGVFLVWLLRQFRAA